MKTLWAALVTVGELAYPRLDTLTPEQTKQANDRRENDRKLISTLKPAKQADIALEEARRIADFETDRRKNADQKATTYLAVVAALIPLILTILATIWTDKPNGAPTWLSVLLLAIAIVYVARAGVWAFRVLEVSASHLPGVSDIDKAWRDQDPQTYLTRQILTCARLNQDGVNDKVSRIKMAHAFLLRGFLAFTFLLLINIGWFIAKVIVRYLCSL